MEKDKPESHSNSVHANTTHTLISGEEAHHVASQQGFALCDEPIDSGFLRQALMSESCGALATFEGWVRNHNNKRAVSHLTYYGYEQLALAEGKKIMAEAKRRFDIENAIAMHRIGELSIGDMAVWVGVVSSYRYPAFDACRWILDTIKAEIPVWKQEFYDDSTSGVPGSLWLSNNG